MTAYAQINKTSSNSGIKLELSYFISGTKYFATDIPVTLSGTTDATCHAQLATDVKTYLTSIGTNVDEVVFI